MGCESEWVACESDWVEGESGWAAVSQTGWELSLWTGGESCLGCLGKMRVEVA